MRLPSFPFLLITVGILFLLGNLGIVSHPFATLWPVLIIVVGAVKIVGAFLN
jgi:hypothetical protein